MIQNIKKLIKLKMVKYYMALIKHHDKKKKRKERKHCSSPSER